MEIGFGKWIFRVRVIGNRGLIWEFGFQASRQVKKAEVRMAEDSLFGASVTKLDLGFRI